MSFDMADYKDVPTRILDFREKHPAGCLRPLDPARPYWIETVGDRTFVVYACAAYRTPDDPMPGVGVAWEPFPGTTNFTRNSELQNAETSAWGRAIVAVLASESKSIASAEDVRNRQDEHAGPVSTATNRNQVSSEPDRAPVDRSHGNNDADAAKHIIDNLDPERLADCATWWTANGFPFFASGKPNPLLLKGDDLAAALDFLHQLDTQDAA